MDISGTWYNELGSVLSLSVSGSSITGTYETAVGSACGKYAITGWCNTTPTNNSLAVGWSVLWNNDACGNSKSLTSWTGQFQITDDSTEEIYAFWLMSREAPSADDWGATNVGQDTFTRRKPSAQEIKSALKKQPLPHPT